MAEEKKNEQPTQKKRKRGKGDQELCSIKWHYRRQKKNICTQPFSYQILMRTGFRLFFRSE
jgi:hypothetical protein